VLGGQNCRNTAIWQGKLQTRYPPVDIVYLFPRQGGIGIGVVNSLEEPVRDGQPPAPESEATVAATDQFVYAISHDLRGPLLNFQGFLRRLHSSCETLRSEAQPWSLTEEQRQCWNQLLEEKVWPSLQVLDRNAKRMERLLSALLELSRAGREPPQFEEVDSSQQLGRLGEEFQPSLLEKNATFKQESLPVLWTDRGRLLLVFRLLLSNALKFLSPKRAGEIAIGGQVCGPQALFWVRDNGIGIKPQHLERLFQPFGRIQEIDGPGEGVGLAIVHKLVGQLHGRVWVESVHGEGSTFRFSLPSKVSDSEDRTSSLPADK